MKHYSKKVLQELTRLSEVVVSRERETKLKELYKLFSAWNKKKISDMEMEAAITSYAPVKDWAARKQYLDSSDPGLPVVEGLLNGILKEEDIPPFVLSELDILKKVVEL